MGVIDLIYRDEAERRAKEVIVAKLAEIERMGDEELADLLDDIAPSYARYQICYPDDFEED